MGKMSRGGSLKLSFCPCPPSNSTQHFSKLLLQDFADDML